MGNKIVVNIPPKDAKKWNIRLKWRYITFLPVLRLTLNLKAYGGKTLGTRNPHIEIEAMKTGAKSTPAMWKNTSIKGIWTQQSVKWRSSWGRPVSLQVEKKPENGSQIRQTCRLDQEDLGIITLCNGRSIPIKRLKPNNHDANGIQCGKMHGNAWGHGECDGIPWPFTQGATGIQAKTKIGAIPTKAITDP